MPIEKTKYGTLLDRDKVAGLTGYRAIPHRPASYAKQRQKMLPSQTTWAWAIDTKYVKFAGDRNVQKYTDGEYRPWDYPTKEGPNVEVNMQGYSVHGKKFGRMGWWQAKIALMSNTGAIVVITLHPKPKKLGGGFSYGWSNDPKGDKSKANCLDRLGAMVGRQQAVRLICQAEIEQRAKVRQSLSK